jgi:hypothetical protein
VALTVRFWHIKRTVTFCVSSFRKLAHPDSPKASKSTMAQANGRFSSGKFIMGAFQKSLTSLIRQHKPQLECRLGLASSWMAKFLNSPLTW